jgi:RNA polymerase sigma-70 factor (ECF subfamily)
MQQRQTEGPPPSAEGGEDEASDATLLERFCAGDGDAATQLYRRYAQPLRAVVLARFSPQLAPRLDVDDVLQSVFRSFFRTAATGVYRVPAGEDLWRLLLTIALNKVRAQGVFHQAAKRDVRATTSLDGAIDLLPGKQDEAARIFLQLALEEALSRLPPQHRVAVELRLQGYEVAAIAQRTGRARRTVERTLQQAQAQLIGLFGERPQKARPED